MTLLVGVGHAVAQDLVAPGAQPRGNIGRHLVYRGVHLGLGGDPELVEQLEEAPDAHAVP